MGKKMFLLLWKHWSKLVKRVGSSLLLGNRKKTAARIVKWRFLEKLKNLPSFHIKAWTGQLVLIYSASLLTFILAFPPDFLPSTRFAERFIISKDGDKNNEGSCILGTRLQRVKEDSGGDWDYVQSSWLTVERRWKRHGPSRSIPQVLML